LFYNFIIYYNFSLYTVELNKSTTYHWHCDIYC